MVLQNHILCLLLFILQLLLSQLTSREPEFWISCMLLDAVTAVADVLDSCKNCRQQMQVLNLLHIQAISSHQDCLL